MKAYEEIPKVSVIVPVYNAERYLKRCIDSILNQTYHNFELLLIDDGSIDGSYHICREYVMNDCRVRLFFQENSGVSAARNRGLQEMSGEYLCFVDSDDWVDPNHIETLLALIKNCDCVCAGYMRGEKANCLEKGQIDLLDIHGGELKNFFVNGFIHPCWNKLFKTAIIEEKGIQFDTTARISEDSLFCLTYLQNAKTLVLSDVCTYHYWHDASEMSLSKRPNTNAVEIYGKVYGEIWKLLRRGNCEMSAAKRILEETIFPQLYSTIIKTVRMDSSENGKMVLYEKLKKTEYVRKILKKHLRNTDVLAEKVTILLALSGQYRTLEYIWKKVIK